MGLAVRIFNGGWHRYCCGADHLVQNATGNKTSFYPT
jgi:hypothetical protein